MLQKCSLDLSSNLLSKLTLNKLFFFLFEIPSDLHLHNFITTLYHAEKIHVKVEGI